MSELTLPHSLEAERAVLGAILIDNREMDAAQSAGLVAEQFFRDAHQRVYRALVGLAERKSALDFVTVRHELERAGDLEEVGAAYLASVIDGGVRSTNLPHYIGIPRQPFMTRPTYLGLAYQGFNTGDPSAASYTPPKLGLTAGVDPRRFADRRQLLGHFDSLRRDLEHRGALEGSDKLRATALRHASGSRTSHATARAPLPAPAAADSSRSRRRAAKATRAPAAAASSPIARPTPDDAPTTSTRRPERS